MLIAFWLLLTYMIASVPTGVVISTLLADADVMLHGSKNIGATNVLRVVGPQYGLATLVGDALKGLVFVALTPLLFPEVSWLPGLVVLTAFSGHCWSCYLDFRGGKGVATGAGAMLALHPLSLVLTAALWGVVYAISRKASLAAIIAVVALQGILWLLSPEHLWVGIALMIGVIGRHHTNIRRLLAGREP